MASPTGQRDRDDGLSYYPFFHDDEVFFGREIQTAFRPILKDAKGSTDPESAAVPYALFRLSEHCACGGDIPPPKPGELRGYRLLGKLTAAWVAAEQDWVNGQTWQHAFRRWRMERHLAETLLLRKKRTIPGPFGPDALNLPSGKLDPLFKWEEVAAEIVGIPSAERDKFGRTKPKFPNLTAGAIRRWVVAEEKRRQKIFKEWVESVEACRFLDDKDAYEIRARWLLDIAERFGYQFHGTDFREIARIRVTLLKWHRTRLP